ncbi:diguanylate cyclase [Rheinheimera tangshanensis]|uniref:diguanylate cyclase n=2 Tax=Rheinheimera tangshanensis TaxID=400153 RepID=A0A5C8M1Q2_9GAMM|nr:diguanylate cyclase [Rheinheimera tangshanensis]
MMLFDLSSLRLLPPSILLTKSCRFAAIVPVLTLWLVMAVSLATSFTALAKETFSLANIQAERRELEMASATDKVDVIQDIDQRIADSHNDQVRRASLYIVKANILQHHGLKAIEDNIAKALLLIDEQTQPELYLYAMVVKSYGMYIYQNQAEQAAIVLEKVQQHPALKNDLYVQVQGLSSLLEVYYKLKDFNKIAKPLFQLARTLTSKEIAPEYQGFFKELDAELAYHSGLIGDTNQAIAGYRKIITDSKPKGQIENIAVANCNIANMYFLPLAEKIQYAKASLAAARNLSCSDAMEKLVLLDEVQQGNLSNIARLSQFHSNQQMPSLNQRSAYYAGLAYLKLNDLAGAQSMANRMTDTENWERYDLLQKIYEKQGNYRDAFTASQRYHQLRAQKDADARALMLSSYQTRLEMAQEDTIAAEQAKQAEQLQAAEQKAEARLQLMLTVIAAGVGITVVLTLYLYRSRQLQRKLQQLSDTDPLTGLLNRRAFLRQAEHLKQLAERQQFPLSVALIDLDFFKQINDQYGHQAGDTVLCAFAKAANSTLRQTDLCGRFGGEEFILLTTQQDTAAFAASLQRLQQCFSELCLQDKQLGYAVSFSAGITTVFEQNAGINQQIEDAIRQADEHLYRAKASGRQQVCTEDLCLQLVSA